MKWIVEVRVEEIVGQIVRDDAHEIRHVQLSCKLSNRSGLPLEKTGCGDNHVEK